MCGSDEHSRVDMLLLLMDYGWTTGNGIIYRPPGDIDSFDLESQPVELWSGVLQMLRKKEAHRDPIGLKLFWQDTDIGGTFTVELYPELPQYVKLWALWNPERRRLPDCSWFTDHSWYLSRVLPPLLHAGVVIDAVECRDIY
jgi:hypothetical protein